MKILFYSPHALADSSSGAAQSVAALLAELVRLGHSCGAVTGSVIDATNELFTRVLDAPPTSTYTLHDVALNVPVRKVALDGVVHLVVGEKGRRIGEMTSAEEVVIHKVFLDAFRDLEPDVVLGYGGLTSNYAAGSFARSRGRKSVLYVASESYKQADHFAYADMVVTVSEAMAKKLAPITQLPTLVLRPFMNIASITCAKRTPEYITLLNPLPAKGVMLAAALAREAARRGRPYKFLFVEGRGTRETMRALCPDALALPSVSIANNTSDVKLVYERSSVILYPSLWFETAGKVPLEANANGIPVLASNIGGIPEMLDGAGYLFDPPAACVSAWETPPPPEYVEQWLAVLDRLHNDPAEHADAVRRARAAAERYNPAQMAQEFVDFVQR